MANTGYEWGSWDYLTYAGPNDIDGYDLDDETTLTSLEFSLNIIAAAEISVKWVEGNDGACDGDVYVYILAYDGESNWQTIDDAITPAAVIDATQNTTRIVNFRILGSDYGSFKILVDNDSGQDGDLTICIRTATIPVAS